MSIRMYCYRITQDQWWEFAKKVREFYKEKHPVTAQINSIRKEYNATEDHEKRSQLFKNMLDVQTWFNQHLDELSVEIQVFYEASNTIIFRLLEAGYLFMNNYDQFNVETVFYDDRSDVPEEDLKNRTVVDWVDDQIKQHKYFIYPIINDDMIWEVITNSQNK